MTGTTGFLGWSDFEAALEAARNAGSERLTGGFNDKAANRETQATPAETTSTVTVKTNVRFTGKDVEAALTAARNTPPKL